MTEHFPLLYNGVPGGGPDLEVHAPYDGALIATLETANAEAAETAMATAYALYRDRDAWLPTSRRIEILEKAAEIMQSRFEELAIEGIGTE